MPCPTAQDAAQRLVILYYVVAYGITVPPKEILDLGIAGSSPHERQALEDLFNERHRELCLALSTRDLWQHATQRETAIFQTPPLKLTEQQKLDAQWRKEAAATLMWGLGILESLPPFDDELDIAILQKIPFRDSLAFVAGATLLVEDRVKRQRETAELWHWRSRTRQLIDEGRPFPAMPQFKSYDEIVRFTAKAAKEKGTLSEIINEDFPAKGKAYRDLTDDEWFTVRSITVERHFALNWLCGYAPGNRWDETPTET